MEPAQFLNHLLTDHGDTTSTWREVSRRTVTKFSHALLPHETAPTFDIRTSLLSRLALLQRVCHISGVTLTPAAWLRLEAQLGVVASPASLAAVEASAPTAAASPAAATATGTAGVASTAAADGAAAGDGDVKPASTSLDRVLRVDDVQRLEVKCKRPKIESALAVRFQGWGSSAHRVHRTEPCTHRVAAFASCLLVVCGGSGCRICICCRSRV